MGKTNLGRVQGASVFVSSAESSTTVDVSTLATSSIRPLVGDSILFADGDIRNVVEVSGDTAICGDVVASVKGAVGEKGEKGDPADNLAAGDNIVIDGSLGVPVISAGPFSDVLYSGNQTTTAFVGDAEVLSKYKMLFVKGLFSNSSTFQVFAVLDPQSTSYSKVTTLAATSSGVTVKSASIKVAPPYVVTSTALQCAQSLSASSDWAATTLTFYITEIIGFKK